LFAFLFDEMTNERFYCEHRFYPEDSVGRKYLLGGEIVSFEISEEGTKGNNRNAKDVCLISTRRPPPENYRETSTVVHVSAHGNYCFLDRNQGDNIFLHNKNVAKHSRQPGRVVFELGQIWEFGVERTVQQGHGWRAIEAVETQPTEENWASFL
jgi:hypothetical protein